jgi:hypothetical protein
MLVRNQSLGQSKPLEKYAAIPIQIALLIDADNAPESKIEAIVSEIPKYEVANITDRR